MDAETLAGLLSPDGGAVSYCSRCRCSVPLDEWELTRGIIGFFRHKGPLRDGAEDRFAVPDEEADDENDQCGWMKRLPEKV